MSLLFLCLFFVLEVNADEYSHIYVDNEEVVLWMNTVGPYDNRQESYAYSSLPFCAGPREPINHYHKTFIEALQGVYVEFSGLEINFKVDIPGTPYCAIWLTKEKKSAFIHAVKNNYWYQMYLDDLPVWGSVGEVEETESGSNYYLWTHKKFEIGYNGKQIVDVNLTTENEVKLVGVGKIQFTYEVIWKNSSIKFEDRVDKYSDPNFYQLHINWFTIFIITRMVIFFIALVSMILIRTFREHYACCSKGWERMDDMDDQKSAVLS